MIINDIQARRLLTSLYNVAEKDRNDIIANAASALAARLENVKREYNLSEIDQRIVQYSVRNQPLTVTSDRPRRKTYKRRVTLA